LKVIRNRNLSLPDSEITPEEIYFNRRQFMVATGAVILGGVAGDLLIPSDLSAQAGLAFKKSSPYSTSETQTDYHSATHYNNYYEFSTDKEEVAEVTGEFKTGPWRIRYDGLLQSPGSIDVRELIRRFPLEERIYRLRCVEGWSMVIPWIGFPLSSLISFIKPSKRAKYMAFETIYAPNQMPGQRRSVLSWPYKEGLRLDEAMHPLTILAVGMYGRALPAQNGAPVRLVVPWKYGFKSIKSIVRLRLTESAPDTTWNLAAPEEYGFYANVNPKVDHPRWSQATERRIGELRRRATLPFNGYEREVAHLYKGMDLRRFY
jgi:sulfoxide reductase catalytic subunit YedY